MYSHLLTCVDGPLFEQTCILVQLPAVSSCMLPGDCEHFLILENTKENTKMEGLHRINSNINTHFQILQEAAIQTKYLTHRLFSIAWP